MLSAGTPIEVPVGYLDLTVSAEAGWADALPAAYLALSEAYVEERQRAAASGMPTSALDLGHVGMLRDPDATAAALVELLAQL